MSRDLRVALLLTALLPAWSQADDKGVFAMTLRADVEPKVKEYEEGATLAFTRTGGSTTAVADGVLGVRYAKNTPTTDGVKENLSLVNVQVVGYLHRDTSASKPRNDRGVSLSYDYAYWPGGSGGAPVRLGWALRASAGKTLKLVEQDSGTERFDVDSDRQVARGTVYWQPKLPGTPQVGRIPVIFYLTGDAGLYSDHVKGAPRDSLNGRLSGVLGSVSATFAPLGMEPKAWLRAGSTIAFVPTFEVSAQVQSDRQVSGGRTRETRHLYSGSLALTFGTPTDTGVPSLILSRKVGADLLTGRPKDGVTELSLGIYF